MMNYCNELLHRITSLSRAMLEIKHTLVLVGQQGAVALNWEVCVDLSRFRGKNG